MARIKDYKRQVFVEIFFTLLFIYIFISFTCPLSAEDRLEAVQKIVSDTIDVQQKTQKIEDKWSDDKSEFITRYQELKSQEERLQGIIEKKRKVLSLQQGTIAEITRKVKESERMTEGLQSYLESVVGRLEAFIKSDLPFLTRERTERLSYIKEFLAHPDNSRVEKYRKVMEAIQIETAYGRTVEAYQERIHFNGQSVVMDILRVGRISLFCQTPDTYQTGYYDRVSKKWLPLDKRYLREINKAVEIARKQRSIEMLTLPIGRIIP